LIPYSAMLDVPAELLRHVSRLLAAERRRRGTPAGSRRLTCRDQAILALRWFRDRTRIEALGRDHGVSPATAAYLANGGASDDGFDYFRGWLIAQGREVFDSAVADPDALAALPAVQAAAARGEGLECETVLSIAWNAYLTATGQQLPDDAFTISYPPLSSGWDFDDHAEMRARLPRLAWLFMDRGEQVPGLAIGPIRALGALPRPDIGRG
jgi:hypothetical protein